MVPVPKPSNTPTVTSTAVPPTETPPATEVAAVPTATEGVDLAAGDEGAIVERETAVAKTPGSNLGVWLLGSAGFVALFVAFVWFRRR